MAVVLVASLGFAPAVYAEEGTNLDLDVEQAEIEARGVGRLTAHGDGIALLAGRGIVKVSGNGILWIKDIAGNATIEVTGQGEKKEFSDGWIQYSGFRGTAKVKGGRFVMHIAGADIELAAVGRGRVFLWGHGTYQLNEQSGRWNTNNLGTRVMIASDDVLTQLDQKRAEINERARENIRIQQETQEETIVQQEAL